MRVRECDHDDAAPGAEFCRTCGTRLTRFEVEINGRRVDPAPSELEDSPRRGRWSLRRRVVTTAAVALVLGLGIAFYEIQDRWYGPSEPVEALISAMEDGDGPAVAAMIADSSARADLKKSAKASPLLAAGALDTGYTPPADMRVTGVDYSGSGDRTQREGGDGAEVSVSYRLGGKDHSASVRVQREASGMFREWRLWPDELLTEIGVNVWHTAKGRYAIAGVHTKAASLVGLPGSYRVTTDPDALYAKTTTRVVVGIGDDATVSVDEPKPKDTTTAAAQTEVRAFVDRCASGGPVDSKCNFNDDRGRSGYVPKDTQWSIEKHPVIELRPYKARAPEALTNGEAEEYGVLMVITKTEGKATGEYENILDKRQTITADIKVTGMVTIDDDGKPEFSATKCPPNERMCLMRGR